MGKLTINALLFCLTIILVACSTDRRGSGNEKTHLLVYCGITMIEPMSDLKHIIEEQENCIIDITKGGSGSLFKAIEASEIGDMYLPGCDSYIETAFSKGLILDTVLVGYNRLAVMVQKGNPLNITSDLINLTNKKYYVVIGNPYSGSVGKTTKTLLQSRGIFQEVERNAIRFTTDSKDLTLAIINKEADIVINWYAPYTWDNNSDYIDIIKIDDQCEQKNALIFCTLKYSKHPDMAKKFLNLAKSKRGIAIFKSYGF